MATYVNDLRLKEIGTGESSGTWGTETNVNLELIGEALGYGTEGITTNADTHTTTVADGSTDPGRAMYIEYTGTLDSACTVTIAPNTLSRLHYIENGTSGSQNIIIKQGSGATVTIPPGDTKAVYLDGAGSGAKVVDVFASFSVVDLKVQDDLTVTDDATIGGTLGVTGILTCTDDIIIGDGKTIGSASDVDAMTIASNGQVTFTQTLIGTALDISGDIDVDGTANLDIVDIDGATNIAAAVTMATNNKIQFRDDAIHISSTADGQLDLVADTEIQIAATTIDINGAINASGEIIAASLDISGNIDVDGTSNLDVVDIDGAVDMASTLQVDGAITSSAGATITVADNSDNLTLTSTDADANVGPNLNLYRNSGSPADDDVTGVIVFNGRNDNSQDVIYARQLSYIKDASDGTEDGQLSLQTMVAGTIRDRLNITPSEIVLNEDSIDLDFRVESNGNANMLFVDGGNDAVGIGTSTPGSYYSGAEQLVVAKASGEGGITIATASDTNGALYFADGTTGAQAYQGGIGYQHDTSKLFLVESGVATMFFGPTEYVFNETSLDRDFRVESNGNANMLFVDGGNDHVSIGTSSDFGGVLNVNGGAVFDDATTFDPDTLGAGRIAIGQIADGGGFNAEGIGFGGASAGGTAAIVASNGTLFLGVGDKSSANTLDSTLIITQAEVAINDSSNDTDFRVESNANTHALFVDAGNSRVGINQSAPAGDFHVTGGADSLIFIDGTASVANSATTLFTISLPSTANAVHCTLFVHGIATGVAWLAFKQDFVAAIGSVIATTAGTAVETSGGGTMTLNVSGTDLNVQFNHGSASASTVNWSAVIQGRPGGIS